VRKLIILLLIISVCSISVLGAGSLSVPLNIIQATNCRFLNATSNVTCGTEATFICDVSNTFSGETITSVKYTFSTYTGGSSSTYIAFAPAGSNANSAQYRALVPAPFSSGYYETPPQYNMTVTSIEISTGTHTCIQTLTDTNPLNTNQCYIKKENPIQPVSCVCGSQNYAIGSCQITDTATATLNSDAQSQSCGNGGTTTTLSCNYCNPLWVSTYDSSGGCGLTKSSSVASGIGTKVYYHAATTNSTEGAACCQITGGPKPNHPGPSTDCTAPPDNLLSDVSVCTMDIWAGRNGGYNTMGRGITLHNQVSLIKLLPASVGTSDIQPIVGDFAADGLTEVFVYDSNIAYIYRYEKTAGSGNLEQGGMAQKLAITESFYMIGQPAIIGIQKDVDWKDSVAPEGVADSNTYKFTCKNSTDYPSCGSLRIAVFSVDNSTFLGEHYNASFRILDATTLAPVFSYQLGASSPDNSGMTCMRRQYDTYSSEGYDCWFVTQDKKLWKVANADGSPTVTSIDL